MIDEVEADESVIGLQAALRFTADDLAANRRGSLSAAQIQRLRYGWKQFALIGLILLVVLGPIALAILSVNQNGKFLIGVILAAIILGGITIGVFSGAINHNRSLQAGVNATTGILHKRAAMGEGRRIHYVKIGTHEFVVPAPAYLWFTEGATYRVYYTYAEEQIVAAEFVSV